MKIVGTSFGPGQTNHNNVDIYSDGAYDYFYDEDDATTTKHGLLSAADKDSLDVLTNLGFYRYAISGAAPGTTVVSDNFDRANTSDIDGSTPSPTAIGTWQQVFAPNPTQLQIVSNKISAAAALATGYHTSTGGLTDCDVSVILSTATITGGGGFALLSNYTTFNTYLFGVFGSGGTVNIYKVVGGSGTLLYSGSVTLSNGDTIHLRTNNGVVGLYQNSTLLGQSSYSSSSLSGTDAGIYVDGNTATVFDNFKVESIGAGVASFVVSTDATLTGTGSVLDPLHVTNAGYWSHNADSSIYFNGGNVGQGITTPTAAFHSYQNNADGKTAFRAENANALGTYKYGTIDMYGQVAFTVPAFKNTFVIEGAATGGTLLGAYDGSVKITTGNFRDERLRIDSIGRVKWTLGSDATGDMWYRNSGGYMTRLPIGSGTQVLGISSGVPAWVSGGGGGGTDSGHVAGYGISIARAATQVTHSLDTTAAAIHTQNYNDARYASRGSVSGGDSLHIKNIGNSDTYAAYWLNPARDTLGMKTFKGENGIKISAANADSSLHFSLTTRANALSTATTGDTINVQSGDASLTLTGITNIASASSATGTYTRTGNVVDVMINIVFTCTAGSATFTEIDCTMPVTPEIPANQRVNGTYVSLTDFGMVGISPAAFNKVRISFYSNFASPNAATVHFQYKIK